MCVLHGVLNRLMLGAKKAVEISCWAVLSLFAIITATKNKKLRLRNKCTIQQKKLFSNGHAHFTCLLNLFAQVTKNCLLLLTNKSLFAQQPTANH